MVNVKKRSGIMQEFDKAKLKKSLKKAGAKEPHVAKVADKIADKVKDGTTTVEIWEWCVTGLKPLDSKAAKSYQNYRKLKKK